MLTTTYFICKDCPILGHTVPVYGMYDTRIKVWFLAQARQFYLQASYDDNPAHYSIRTFSTRRKVAWARSWPLKSIYCQGKECTWLTSNPPYAFMACTEDNFTSFYFTHTESHLMKYTLHIFLMTFFFKYSTHEPIKLEKNI